MAGDKNIYKKAKGFDKHPENINKAGAPKKTISFVNDEMKAEGYLPATKVDIVGCYLTLINLPLTELTKKVKDDKQPALVRIVGKAILSGKGFEVIEKMLDRGIGKADQKIEHSGNAFENVTIEFKK